MPRKYTNRNVFQAALDRLVKVYQEGHRVVVAFSGGKDSNVCLELAIMAAKKTGNLPVEAMFRDDEILYPGTAEYVERTWNRPEVNLHWIGNRQASPNIYNRELPWFWVFDEKLSPDQWVRQPPPYIEWDYENINLYYMINRQKYPPPPGKKLVPIVGIRVSESKQRSFAIASAKGARSVTKDDARVMNLYPIYDWLDGDIWLAIQSFGWDYNTAYDAMSKMGVKPSRQRIAQVAMTALGIDNLQIAAKLWPKWFDRVSNRLPGVRAVVHYGEKVLRPERLTNETWEECYYRTCITTAPEWIKSRSMLVLDKILKAHSEHSTAAFPEMKPCKSCKQSWQTLAHAMYSGDPFHIEIPWLPDAEPSMFRPEETRLWPKTRV